MVYQPAYRAVPIHPCIAQLEWQRFLAVEIIQDVRRYSSNQDKYLMAQRLGFAEHEEYEIGKAVALRARSSIGNPE